MFLVATILLTLGTALLAGMAYRRRGAWCWLLPVGISLVPMLAPAFFYPLGEIIYFQFIVGLVLLFWFALAVLCFVLDKTFLRVAVVLAYIPLACHVSHRYDDWKRHLKESPLVDLANRAREPESAGSFDEPRLAMLENQFASSYGTYRERRLRRLHEGVFLEFVEAPNFGIRRMLNENYSRTDRTPGSIENQPGPPIQIPWPEDEGFPNTDFLEPHFKLVSHFSHPVMNGWTKGNRVAAGFARHALTELEPLPKEINWRIHRLDLLGLVVHPEPVVYVSEKLPAMREIGRVPTRKPDPFESFALEKLRKGEDLLYYEVSEGMRMLGAIRNAAKCVDCHGGKRGDLLGAFSYTLKKE